MANAKPVIPRRRAIALSNREDNTVPVAKLGPPSQASPKPLSRSAVDALAPCAICGEKHVDEKGRRTCIAHVKVKGGVEPCRAPQHTAEGRCLQCAGRIKLRGQDAHDWRAGLYSERMPEKLRYVFDRAAERDAMVSMKYQLALIDAREVQLLERLGTQESAGVWLELREKAKELKSHIEAEDAARQAKTLWEMLKLIEDGSNDDATWLDIRDNAEFRRRLTETERKHIDAQRTQMSYEQVAQIASFLGNLLKRYITDPARLEAAAVELARYFDGTPVSRAPDVAPQSVIDVEEIEDGYEEG